MQEEIPVNVAKLVNVFVNKCGNGYWELDVTDKVILDHVNIPQLHHNLFTRVDVGEVIDHFTHLINKPASVGLDMGQLQIVSLTLY